MLFSLVQLFHLFCAIAYFRVFDFSILELGGQSKAYDEHSAVSEDKLVPPDHEEKLLTAMLRRPRQLTKSGDAGTTFDSNTTTDIADSDAAGDSVKADGGTNADPYRVGQCPLIIATGGNYGKCAGGVATSQKIWSDRSYEFIKAPGDLLGGNWAYQQVELSEKPPCSNEGGFKGKVEASGSVAVCLASHCESNEPTGSHSWKGVGETYDISNHAGSPCKFYQTYAEAGTELEICGSNCWASGIFYRKGSEQNTQLADSRLHIQILRHLQSPTNHMLWQLLFNAGLAIMFGIFGAYMWFNGGIRARGQLIPFPHGPRNFPDGLCNFTQDMNACLLTCFCSPVANSEVANVITAMGFWPSMLVLCFSLLLPYGLGYVVLVGFRLYTRQVFREKANFTDECCMDLVYSCLPCFGPCTTCQELRFLKKLRSGYAGVGPAVGVSDNSIQTVIPQGAPGQLAVNQSSESYRGLEGQPIMPPPDPADDPSNWLCCGKRWGF